jgi:putative oxidoreductase
MIEFGRRFFALHASQSGGYAPSVLTGFVDVAEVVGRTLLAMLFILEAIAKLQAYEAAAKYMAAFGMPPSLLQFAVTAELSGGVLIALGWYTRPAALMLAGFCAVAAIVFHTRFSDHNQLLHFEKDFALAGAFLILSIRGAGRFAFDSIGLRRARKSQSSTTGPQGRIGRASLRHGLESAPLSVATAQEEEHRGSHQRRYPMKAGMMYKNDLNEFIESIRESK